MLPNFLAIGAPRAGSTSLYHYLREHPDVYMSPIKETNYFWYEGQQEDRPAIRTRAEYERLFDGVKNERAIGEASPQYLGSRTAPERIARELPDVRLIVSLRNPADRAWSAWQKRVSNGRETRPPHQVLRPGSYAWDRSLYCESLSRYLARFGRERIAIILFDDLVKDAPGTMRSLFAFLGVDPDVAVATRVRHNEGRMPRSQLLNRLILGSMGWARNILPHALRNKGLAGRLRLWNLRPPDPMPAKMRRELLASFESDIRATSALIGRDLTHWLQP